MGNIKGWVDAAIESAKLDVELVEPGEAASLRRRIEETYASSKGRSPLWERLQDAHGRHDSDGWKAMAGYPYQGEVTIFFDSEREEAMFTAKGFRDLARLIGECPGFVFYVTNSACSFLLCHNDHDYLIAAGEAKNWVKQEKHSNSS